MSPIQVQEVPGKFAALGQANDDIVSQGCRIVAVRGAIGDWAAYVGNPDASPAEVAQYGHKLTREAARQLFPNISGAYRE